MPKPQPSYSRTFDRFYTSADQAVTEIVGRSRSSRQLHSVRAVLFALADECARLPRPVARKHVSPPPSEAVMLR
jgi:hypothetical protein